MDRPVEFDDDVAVLLQWADVHNVLLSLNVHRKVEPVVRGKFGSVYVRDEANGILGFEYRNTDIDTFELDQTRHQFHEMGMYEVFTEFYSTCWAFNRRDPFHAQNVLDVLAIQTHPAAATKNQATADRIRASRKRRKASEARKERALHAALGAEYYTPEERSGGDWFGARIRLS